MSNIKNMPVPETVGIELYNLGGGKYGARVVLPEGRQHTDYSVSDGTRIRVCGIEHQISQLLAGVAIAEDCVEVVYFDGTVIDVSDKNVGALLEESMRYTLEKLYEDEVAKGIVPRSVTFEQWVEEEYSRINEEQRVRMH